MSHEDIRSLGRQLRQIEDPRTRALFERILQNQDIIRDSLAALEAEPDPEWIDLDLKNSWVTFDTQYNRPEFMKTREGFVFIRGLIKNGTVTAGTQIAAIPVGYRPERIHIFAVDSSGTNTKARIDVKPDGVIVGYDLVAAYTCLDGIIYRAYQ